MSPVKTYEEIVREYKKRQHDTVVDTIATGLTYMDEVAVDSGLLEETGILTELTESMAGVLPFVIISVHEGTKVLLGRKPGMTGLKDGAFRMVKTGAAMGVGAAVAGATGFWAAIPVTMGVRALFDRYRSKTLTDRNRRDSMRFTKMQGLGNDYIYVNCLEETVPDPVETARKISDRHFGVGSDGLVLILPDEEADFRMRMFNSDGSESEMCGNAARCVGKYIHDRGLSDKEEIRLMTGAGIKTLKLSVRDGRTESVRVDMGEPILEAERIPTTLTGLKVINTPVEILGETYGVTCVSMGNPHAVIFVEDADHTDVHTIGPVIENYPLFPRKTNVEFVTVNDRGNLRMRVWERGAGETMACGTGACATLVAAVLNGLCERKAILQLNGGPLTVEWDPETNHVFQEGPAEFVFDGIY